jgi:ankyrin repeat protein
MASTYPIYVASYSNIPVYECIIRGNSIMKRVSDSSLNATQILKVANLEKALRTRIIEKEIIQGEHEKIQGGYGKYQGTWIPFERGVELAKQYGVYDLLQRLLDFQDEGEKRPNSTTRRRVDSNASQITPRKRKISKATTVGSMTPSPYINVDRQDTPTPRERRISLTATLDASEIFKDQLAALFLAATPSDEAEQEALLTRELNPDVNVNVVIDDQGHAAIHWAAALARINLLNWLVTVCDADMTRRNTIGETALMRAVLATNNYENKTFEHVLDILGETLGLRDNQGRSMLHHIAIVGGIKGRARVAKYYMQTTLKYLQSKSDDSKWLMDTVDMRDEEGNTALCIAARVASRVVVELLVDIGADREAKNFVGLAPNDFGIMKDELAIIDDEDEDEDEEIIVDEKQQLESTAVDVKKGEIMSMMERLLQETTVEYQNELAARHDMQIRWRMRLKKTIKDAIDAKKDVKRRHEERNVMADTKITNRNMDAALKCLLLEKQELHLDQLSTSQLKVVLSAYQLQQQALEQELVNCRLAAIQGERESKYRNLIAKSISKEPWQVQDMIGSLESSLVANINGTDQDREGQLAVWEKLLKEHDQAV